MDIKTTLYHRSHTNTIPVPLIPLRIGTEGGKENLLTLNIRVCRVFECVRAVLHHARSQAMGELLGGFMELIDHGVALPPALKADFVCVDPRE